MYFLSLIAISPPNCSGVKPEALTSPRSGIVIMPSGRTSKLPDRVVSFSTVTVITSDAPMT